MIENILISVIIPNFNGLKYLKDCINSLAMQSFKDFEIIVVDNGSSDGSCDYIKQNYSNIILIQLDNNYGFSKAVNKGIEISNSRFVVLLNNDTVVDSSWLNNLVRCIEKDDKIYSCCSKMIRYYEKCKIDDAGDEYNILGWAYKRGDGAGIHKYVKDQQTFSSCAGAAIYRREVFDKIGYFDENFFAYMEDVDISYRANINGYKNVYCSNAIVYHIGSATSGSMYNSFKIKLAARNNIFVLYKNMPFIQLLINAPFLMLGWTIKLLFFYKKGFIKEYIDGTKEAFSSLKKIKKVKIKACNLVNYFILEIKMIINTFKYVLYKMR